MNISRILAEEEEEEEGLYLVGPGGGGGGGGGGEAHLHLETHERGNKLHVARQLEPFVTRKLAPFVTSQLAPATWKLMPAPLFMRLHRIAFSRHNASITQLAPALPSCI